MNFLQKNSDIWVFCIDEIDYEGLDVEILSILHKVEISKANSFFQIQDTNKYLLSRILLRSLLSWYYPRVKPKEWDFSTNEYGKLELSKKHNIQLFFNLSYTKNRIAIIFNKKNKCGIDIEQTRNILFDDMIDLVFTKQEKILFIKHKNQEELFFILWTLKESLLKAMGKGFFIAPNKIDFSFVKEKDFSKNFSFIKDGYHFAVFKQENRYLSCAIQSTQKDIQYNLIHVSHLKLKQLNFSFLYKTFSSIKSHF